MRRAAWISLIAWIPLAWLVLRGKAEPILRVPGDHPTIQAAIDAAEPGDEIRVARGTYVESIDFKGKAVRVVSEAGPAATTIRGRASGFAVRFESGETWRARLRGFTIEARSGIRCRNASPTIDGNDLRGDGRLGIGIGCAEGASPCILGNRITGFGGAGIACDRGAPRIESNRIARNRGGQGGGLALTRTHALVIGNRITENTAGVGGGLFAEGGSPRLAGNLIAGNHAGLGGGLCAEGATLSLMGNTIAANRAERCGGILLRRSAVMMVNTIVRDNGTQATDEIQTTESALEVSHSNIRGGWPGEGNLDVDPRFVDPESLDFHLHFASPGRGAGSRVTRGEAGFDFDGDRRGVDGRVDVGADEFAHRAYPVTAADGTERLRIIGRPGSPARVVFSARRLGHSEITASGDYFVLQPPVHEIHLPNLPPTGWLEIPLAAPPGFSPLAPLHIQAVVGDRLTALFTWTPRKPE